jgi:hypothetical protein
MNSETIKNCIDACYACAQACDNCSTACLKEGHIKMLSRCIELDMYCGEICRLAAAYMAKGSQFINDLCQLCAKVCDACGEECAKHDHDHCKICAEACKLCADACRKMSA